MTNQITTGNVDARQAGQAVAQQMNAIFDTLKNFYTQYYLVIKSEKQELQMMRQWAAELMRSGVSEDMLRIGMARAKSHARGGQFLQVAFGVRFYRVVPRNTRAVRGLPRSVRKLP